MKEADLITIQEIVKDFLYLSIKIIDGVFPEICVEHPFLISCIVTLNGSSCCNILEDVEELVEWQKRMEKLIEDSNLHRLFVLVRKGYRLALLKYCGEYLS